MDAVNDPSVHTVVVMKSAQIGWTEIIGNVIGYYIDHDPCPILLIQPTLEMAQAWSKDRFAPMLRDTPCLRGKVKDPRSRDSDNTILHKQFPGGHITIAGANSPAGLASRPIRIVLCDEVDRYPLSAGSEGDPVNLARKRSTTFWNRKLLIGSTPTIKGISRIEPAFELSDKRYFNVPCPHCEVKDVLKWKNVKWPSGKPHEAHYVCEHCGGTITDNDKMWMLRRGEWIATEEFSGTAGFHISELYSPWVSFGEMASNFIEAKELPETLQTWVNTALGETWEDTGEQVEHESLMARREDYEVPDDVMLVTAFADVQSDRIEVEFVGWGRGEESWGLDYVVIWGDPTQDDVWNKLDAELQRQFIRDDGAKLAVTAAGIDSGYLTDYVYNFVQDRQARRIFATKGAAGERPIIAHPRVQKSPRGGRQIKLFLIGVDTAKGVVISRLKRKDPGPGYCHFPLKYDEEYFAQLTAEKMVTKFKKGKKIIEWVKTRTRNEALDVRIGNLAIMKLINPNWDTLESMAAQSIVETEKKDEQPDKNVPIRQSRRRTRQTYVNRWRR